MSGNYAISSYPDARAVTAELDALIKKPITRLRREALEHYLSDYFEARCGRSQALNQAAMGVIPGGVQHNLSFNYPFPLAMDKAEGPYLWDVDGNRYFDLLQAGGPTVLGSNPTAVREKVIELLNHCGPVTGLFHEYEYLLAEKISGLMPAVQKFRMLGSGNEAGIAAIRVARLATRHKHILKMGGAYHGWSDQLCYSLRAPYSRGLMANGVPGYLFRKTGEFFPNDLNDLERQLKLNRGSGGTAAVFIEPLGPESGTRPLDFDFNKGVEALCHKYGALLVFDEVVTGFRVGLQGAQGYFGVSPDLTMFGKVMGGGYPSAGGLGGKDEYMRFLGAGLTDMRVKTALVGGTLAANPLTCVAGYQTICEIEATDACAKAGLVGDLLTAGLKALIAKRGLPFVAYNQGSVCHLQTTAPMHFVVDWSKPWKLPSLLKETAARKEAMEELGAALSAEGLITLAGSRFYTSAAYTPDMVPELLAYFDRVFANIEV